MFYCVLLRGCVCVFRVVGGCACIVSTELSSHQSDVVSKWHITTFGIITPTLLYRRYYYYYYSDWNTKYTDCVNESLRGSYVSKRQINYILFLCQSDGYEYVCELIGSGYDIRTFSKFNWLASVNAMHHRPHFWLVVADLTRAHRILLIRFEQIA